ncbi:energy transducer TonB, partial [Rhodobacterales bacterium HKCCSP123]|nr:energy transducer TonB [Rhodobacterales bacterium HKCCSP123]
DAVTEPTPPAQPSGPPLTAAARDGFRIAVSSCWNVGSLSNEAQATTVVVGFDMSREGRPVDGTLRLVSYDGGSQSAAQQAYEAARRAILRCGANGYGLPAESYDHWRQVELVFNPEGMRLR